MHESPPPDARAEHDGVIPWWIEPRWMPVLPPTWDIASQFRELLRYSVAGAFQGGLVVSGTLLLAALGLPLRGIALVPFVLGYPAWIVSALSLVPRKNRHILRDFAWRFPGLWEWSRWAVLREDRRAARSMLFLHALVFALLLPTAWLLGPVSSARVYLVPALGTAVVLTALSLAVLLTWRNSASLPPGEILAARALTR